MPADQTAQDRELVVLREVTTAAAAILTAPRRRAAALAYLDQRGIESHAILDSWPLGYAPPGWTRLLDTLAGQFPDEVLLAAGIARLSSRGTLIDAFRDRVIFPIHDRDGQVAGFIGRDLSGASHAPKYLNTRRHARFNKSSLLYGLQEAKAHPSPAAQPVVVEGPLDVLAITAAAHRQHVTSGLLPVAACGTAFTSAHARLLTQVSPDWPAVVAMDGDAPGRSAATTVGELLRQAGLEVHVAVLPNGLDPAELLARGGDVNAFTTSAALPLLSVHVERAIAAQGDRMQWVEGRLAAARAITSYLSTYPVERAARQIGWISDALQLNFSSVTQLLAEAFLAPTPSPSRGRNPTHTIEPMAAPALTSPVR